jgi:hypothetical protein
VSEVSDVATARLLIADYAGVDTVGKLNVVGGLITVLGSHPAVPGMTSPFTLVMWVSVPPTHYGAECSVEVVLEDASGEPVSVPGPAGESGIMRIVERVTFKPPVFPGPLTAPSGLSLPSRAQWVAAFPIGVPLAAGKQYSWRVKIDDVTRDDWTEDFVVVEKAPAPETAPPPPS